jgi:hypothetical protein
MTGFNYVFDATQYAPEQGSPTHPSGKFPAYISGTSIQPTKDNEGGMFAVEYTTAQGKISHRFNLWNQNQKAVDIAHKQLSALSHSVGVFKIDMNNEGAALRNARLMIEVGKQKDSEYTEVKRVYDANGNEPGKAGSGPATNGPGFAPAPQQAPQGFAPQAQPQQQAPAPAAAWGAPQQQQAPEQAPANAPWGGGAPTQQAPAPAAQPGPAQGWQQGGAPAPQQAPWGAR